MKKWVLNIILAAVLVILILAGVYISVRNRTTGPLPMIQLYCIGNQANIQSISCTRASDGYLIQTKLNYSLMSNQVNISRIAFGLYKNGGNPIIKFLNFSSSDYSFTINDSEAAGLREIGVALKIKDSQCAISDTKDITCS